MKLTLPVAWPPPLTLDGHALAFKPVSPHRLLLWIGFEQLIQIVPELLVDEDRMHVLLRLHDLDDPLTWVRVGVINKEIIQALCGTTYIASQQLARRIVEEWFPFQAWCIMNNFNPTVEPLHRTIPAAYQYVAQGLDTKQNPMALRQLQMQLWPPDENDRAVEEERAIGAAIAGNMKLGEIAR